MTRQRLAARALGLGGLILMGMGFYFALLRPALLPEDLGFMGATIAEVRTALPWVVALTLACLPESNRQ